VVAFHCVQGLAPEDVRDALMRRIPRYAVPQQVLRLTDIPLTPNGKIDRKLLVEMLEAGAVAVS
jgi:acyl-CoA synthetase (AMP-forming)/AMP-acid ligase II